MRATATVQVCLKETRPSTPDTILPRFERQADALKTGAETGFPEQEQVCREGRIVRPPLD
jgi:hypothetical protein